MADTPSFLFYDDEDKILPLLLHAADAQGQQCQCRDCLALHARIKQIELLQSSVRADRNAHVDHINARRVDAA